MEEIIQKCKCGIYLSVNQYRDYYQSIEDAVKEERERNSMDIDDELAARMVAEKSLISLQFYPNTPVGFYIVYGTTLDEVVTKAKSVINSL